MKPERSARRRALEAEGVHFIDTRERIVKFLMKLAFHVDPDISLALIRHLAAQDWGGDELA